MVMSGFGKKPTEKNLILIGNNPLGNKPPLDY